MGKNVHLVSESGHALAKLAVYDETKGINGKYYEGLVEIKSSTDRYLIFLNIVARFLLYFSYNEDKQKDLWATSVRLISSTPEEVNSPV